MAMKVNHSELGRYGEKIKDNLAALNKALDQAKSAGESAVAAGGGTGTNVGKAIQTSIADFPVSQHGSAVEVINSLLGALLTVSNTYKKADQDLVDQINAIKRKADALVASKNGNLSSGGGAPHIVNTVSRF